MAYHVFTHEISDWNDICHITFLKCVRIDSHSPSLTNVENSTSNFRQSVQICCREEQKEENNGNWKAFGVTRKRKKRVMQ